MKKSFIPVLGAVLTLLLTSVSYAQQPGTVNITIDNSSDAELQFFNKNIQARWTTDTFPSTIPATETLTISGNPNTSGSFTYRINAATGGQPIQFIFNVSFDPQGQASFRCDISPTNSPYICYVSQSSPSEDFTVHIRPQSTTLLD